MTDIRCLFGWEWTCMSTNAWAAWFQAAGTVAAIYFAGALARRQHRVDHLFRLAQQHHELAVSAERIVLYLGRVQAILNEFLSRLEVGNAESLPPALADELVHLEQALVKMDVNSLAPEVAIELIRSIEPVKQGLLAVRASLRNVNSDTNYARDQVSNSLRTVDGAMSEVEYHLHIWQGSHWGFYRQALELNYTLTQRLQKWVRARRAK